ncbi:phosphate ABC transporter substrate-binding protein PstS [Miniimonas arenae]|uniref:Phosphate-binding protein n=1 Tax=Miniimonas arenae TaxID=676201 RepID=A0A5C5BG91_9MICO|nr:phosphate ABC transporter substrate-binding protein PstS [Miniimonas arenae]
MGNEVKQSIRRGTYAILAASTALVLAACGSSASSGDSGGSDSTAGGGESAASGDLSGNLAGAGASSQAKAQEGWVAGFTEANPDVTVTYDPVGSGGGREQFLAGGTLFAGTDSNFNDDELASGTERCAGGEVVELPVYISPIAVVYNLPDAGVEHIQLDADTLAKVFSGAITTWDDAAIAALNPDATLPATKITVVNRSDDSGTTKNFTDYLGQTAPDVWTYEADDAWPIASVQSGDGTSGMIATVGAAVGAIGYADASQAGDLGTVAVQVGEDFVGPDADAAAKGLDASPLTDDATDLRITYKIDRTTTEAGAYPLILVSYLAGCSTYDSASDAANVAAYFTYVTSEEGQARAAEPSVAGSAPISDDLRTKIDAAIAQIKGA